MACNCMPLLVAQGIHDEGCTRQHRPPPPEAPDAARGNDQISPPAVELDELLDEVLEHLIRYVVFPSPEAACAVTLYIAATHAQPAWEHATRLVVKSPLKRCGKSRLQEVIAETAHKALRTTNISPAALARSIDEHDPPTLILDEADTVFGSRKQRSESAEDLRGILNSGHSRGWPYIRWDANRRQAEHCATFAMAVIGGIGDMPDTIEDRAVVISMRRRAPGESVTQWRSRRVVPRLRALRDRLHAVVATHAAALADAEPDLPVEDRAADVWEPLVAIADAAGGSWPVRARQACRVLTADAGDDMDTASERLLADLYAVWGTADHVPTSVLLDRLHDLDEAPWSAWYGRPLSARDLAGLLKPYGIRSRTVRLGQDTPKGYRRADLPDVWRRYVPQAQQPPQAPQTGEPAGQPRGGYVADDPFASATRPDLGKHADVSGVADVSAQRADGATEDDP